MRNPSNETYLKNEHGRATTTVGFTLYKLQCFISCENVGITEWLLKRKHLMLSGTKARLTLWFRLQVNNNG